MADIVKLSTLLDDPEVRELLFGLAHVGSARKAIEPGAPRLRAVVLEIAGAATPEQCRSWLSDEVHNQPMTAEQARTVIGDDVLDDLAVFTGGTPAAIAWQLAGVLPDLVDAVTPGGLVVDAIVLARELAEATLEDDREAGSFGSHVH